MKQKDQIKLEPTIMTAEKIISRLRAAIDGIYEKYEGHPLVEEEDIMGYFEDIINDYYEDISPY